MTVIIRPFEPDDWPQLWDIMRPVFRAGETYAFDRDMTEAEARRIWIDAPAATFVAVDKDGAVLGTYYIKPNQPGQGAHVCNCGYITSEAARGQGVASTMCVHSQGVARDMGFLAMQYNLVAVSNDGARKLWQRHGFDIVGTLPAAFRHPRLGLVDAHVMYKRLD